MEILDGKKISAKVRKDLKLEVDNLKKEGIKPKLAVIMIGDNLASKVYIRNKNKACEEIGVEYEEFLLDEDTTMEELLNVIDNLNKNQNIDGILLQSPIPKHLDINKAFRAIMPEKDVDGFRCDSLFKPATPLGIMNYLNYCGFDFEGKEVMIIGRSNIVGKPLAEMMTDRDATVTLCHSHSKLSNHLYSSDLIVSAVGKPGFLNCYPIHVPVVDVGINFVDGKLVGDCYNTEGRNVTPVPGGVGLLTRLALLENVVKAKELRDGQMG